MEKRSHRSDINRPRSRHGHKYSKNKKCLSIKRLHKNVSIHEKVKQR